MWSIFSRDPASTFNYDILEHCSGLEEKSLWRLHKGKKKGSTDEYSVFVFDLKNASETQVQVAKTAFKKMKTLRHPNLVTYVDGLESDKVLYAVTEPVIPLITYLNEHEEEGSRNQYAISWGIHQITKGLTFMIKDCHLIHNNICLSSIFVNKAGEWLVGGLEYIYPSQGEQSVAPIKIMPLLEKYEPPERSTQRISPKTEWSTDMWGLGCLIWEVFNGQLNKSSDLKSLGKLPKSLTGGYASLVGANPKSRPNPVTFLSDSRRKGGFLANKFVDAMIFIEEIQIKERNQKTAFLESLNSEIADFPSSFCKHKILPQLVNAFEFGDAGVNILMPLLKVGKMLEPEQYQKQVVPCIVKMFNITDRQTRVKLLQQMNLYIQHIPVNTVNDQLFPTISMGFNDTNPLVRETTIKAMLHMANKLNYKNLNEELMKHFARLQSKDDQGGIRTNTTVCLGKIACYLNPQIRQKVLPSAYTRALRDPFAPARQATLLAMQASVQYFPVQDLATRLLPSICPLTRDPEKSVRDQAFTVIEFFVKRLHLISDDLEALVEMEKELTSSSSTVPESQSWTGWAMTAGATSFSSLSSLTSKFKGQGKVGGAEQAGSTSQPKDEAAETSTNQSQSGVSNNQPIKEELSADGDWEDTDEWAPMELGQSKSAKSSVSSKVASPEAGSEWDEPTGGDWGSAWDDGDDDEFEPIEPSAGVSNASSYNWDSHSPSTQSKTAEPQDFFSSITDKPAVKSQESSALKKSGWSDDSGWDDAGDWGSNSTDSWDTGSKQTGTTAADEKKRERELKRQERQQALAQKKTAVKPSTGGRAMKLGAKKLAKD